MKNKYVMSRLLALGMAATLTASNLPMSVSAADETVEVSQTTEQAEQNTDKQETEETQTEGTQQEETTEGTTEEVQPQTQPESQPTENAGTENAGNEALPQLNTGLIQAGKYDAAGNWVPMEGNELLTNDQVIFNVKHMVPEGYTYNSASILVDGQWIQADENGYVVVNKTSTATQVGMWLEKDGQTLAEPVMASVNYTIKVDQTAPVIKELAMYTMGDNGSWEDFKGGVTNKDVMLDMVAEDDVEVDYVFYTSETGSTPVFEKIPGTNNAYRYVFKEAGVYNGVISVKDKAGNYTEQAVSFTIDKTVPTLDELHVYAMNEDGTYEDLAEGGSTGKNVMIDVVANDDVEVDYVFYTSETGSTPVFEKIAGTDNAYRHIFTKPGTYDGVISVKDKAGNYTEQKVSFTIKEKRDTLMVVSFETVDGKKVGKEVVLKKQGLDGEDVTFELGKDFQIPEGYQLANGKDQTEVITVPAGTTGGHTVLVEKEKKDVLVNYVLEDGTNVGTGSVKVDKDSNSVSISLLTDVPYGYELVSEGEINLNEGGQSVNIVVREKEYQKDVMVNYVLEDGSNVGTGSVKIHKDYSYVDASWLTDVPYGYELVSEGEINLNEGGQSVNIVVREKEYQKDVIINYVDETGNLVLTSSIKLEKDATYFNTSILKDVPYGWELANIGDVTLSEDGKSANVVVREKKYQKDVMVNYVLEDGSNVGTGSAKIHKDYNYVNTSWLTDVPYGYELVNTGDIDLNKDGQSVNIVVREKEYQKDVIINYVDEAGNLVLTSSIKLEKDATYFNTSILKDVPYGWELANIGDVTLSEDGKSANVVVREKKYQKDVMVNYVLEDGSNVGTGSVKIHKDYNYVNTSWLTDVPYGYELANVGDINLNADGQSVNIVVREKEYQKDVMVNYVLEDGSNVGTGSVKIHKDYNYVNTSWLTDVPYGYELANVGDINLNADGQSVNIVVREKEYQKDIMVNYVLEDGSNVGTGSVKIHKDYNYVNTSWLTDVPYGYELANVGDINLNADGQSVNIVVREKEYQKDVMVNYVLENGNSVGTGSVKIHKDYTYVNTGWLTDVPYGYELAIVGDINLNADGQSVNIVVREKEYQKDVMVNYVLEDGSNVGTGSVKIHKDYNYVNTSWLTDVPYGYELAIVGDINLNADGQSVNIVVREKEYQKDVMVNYVLEDGSNVGTGSVKIHKDYNYVNTSWLTDVPYGYELAIVGDINLNADGQSVNIVVREKEYTKDISVEYVTEDGTLVGKGSLTVAEESTYINTSWLQDVPEGYEIAIVGDLPIENNVVKVVVRTTEDPENPDPENPDKPDPEKPDKPSKPDPEKPNKDDNNKDDGKTQNTDKKTDGKAKTPKTGDDLQAAGTFSILGAGALAAIAALLKKRK